MDEADGDSKPRAKEKKSSAHSGKPLSKRKAASPWHDGCVPLSKSDDPHWIPDTEAHVRKHFVEVFSLKKADKLDGYTGRKEPAIGQVGIRCVFCAKAEESASET